MESDVRVRYETLKVTRVGPVGWLVNARPDKLNAMNARMREELADAWQELDRDPGVRVIVHAAEGRAFQTGVDIDEAATDGLNRYQNDLLGRQRGYTCRHRNVAKPVIAAVNGMCVGGGLQFVADADIVIAASDATFFDPHVSVGQVSAMEVIGLARRIPFEAVMRMALVGRHERIGADRAYELGMISQVVDPPELLRAEAQQLAETIARNSPAALRATKRALWAAQERGLTEATALGAQFLVSLWGHPDQREGFRAFVEKREPDWQD
jgi:enoyl-CoA hydratase